MLDRLYQGMIHQLKDTLDGTVGVLDEQGTVIASNDRALIGETRARVRE